MEKLGSFGDYCNNYFFFFVSSVLGFWMDSVFRWRMLGYRDKVF